MRRWARSTNTQKAVTASTTTIRTIAKRPLISPVLICSTVRPIAPGNPATMPPRMIIEMPLPTPRSVICSPSHIRNIVPVVMVTVATNRNCQPGASTMPCACRPLAVTNDWNSARPTVP